MRVPERLRLLRAFAFLCKKFLLITARIGTVSGIGNLIVIVILKKLDAEIFLKNV